MKDMASAKFEPGVPSSNELRSKWVASAICKLSLSSKKCLASIMFRLSVIVSAENPLDPLPSKRLLILDNLDSCARSPVFKELQLMSRDSRESCSFTLARISVKHSEPILLPLISRTKSVSREKITAASSCACTMVLLQSKGFHWLESLQERGSSVIPRKRFLIAGIPFKMSARRLPEEMLSLLELRSRVVNSHSNLNPPASVAKPLSSRLFKLLKNTNPYINE
mmetsp:Transcript_37722/g.100190  ORF Transcript_37722/g.100190 Transcript_37722/m.100190 type:complete len:224 (+) Transcript_37722:1141-1812(+)